MIAKGSGYVRGNRDVSRARLVSHLKYVEHRSRESSLENHDDRCIFSKDEDVVNRRDAVNDVMEHTSTSVNYHKIVLSPSEDEHIDDWREWTRRVMHDFEEVKGQQLTWYAVHHQNTDHPHVHVVLAGAGYNREKDREERVTMYTNDYVVVLNELGRKHSDYDFHRLIEEQFHELDTLDHAIDHELKAPQPEQESLEDIER